MKVLLREACHSDLELILAWRSIPQVIRGIYSQSRTGFITWDEHYNWWHSRHNWKIFIIQVNDNISTRDVGVVSLSQLDNWKPQVGIIIGEVTLWGRGVGRQALLLALNWLREKRYSTVFTTILKNNERSIRLFEAVGFKRVSEGREGEWEYQVKL